jgi:hypothetical protein
MAPRFLTILTGRNVPKIGQPREPEPSTINEKTIADFTRVSSRREFWSASRRLIKRDRRKRDAKLLRAAFSRPPRKSATAGWWLARARQRSGA